MKRGLLGVLFPLLLEKVVYEYTAEKYLILILENSEKSTWQNTGIWSAVHHLWVQ